MATPFDYNEFLNTNYKKKKEKIEVEDLETDKKVG